MKTKRSKPTATPEAEVEFIINRQTVDVSALRIPAAVARVRDYLDALPFPELVGTRNLGLAVGRSSLISSQTTTHPVLAAYRTPVMAAAGGRNVLWGNPKTVAAFMQRRNQP